jgi:23S rRNA pseudouridine2605 synthase
VPDDDDIRINRYLAAAGFGSRRAVETLILQRKVTVNGKIVDTLGVRIGPGDLVKVSGRPVEAEATIHVLLHKPAGVVTTAKDPEGRPTVVELVRIPQRLFPVGRLDANTTGALVLTNDGELANRLMHPRYGVEKTYHATVSRIPTTRGLEALANGVMLDDGPTAPAQVELVRRAPPTVELVLHEGRNRQVRRMIEAIGHSVVHLHRPTYGGIGLGGLAEGTWRFLSPAEVATLRKSTGAPRPRPAGARPKPRPRRGPGPGPAGGSRPRTSA